MKRLGTALFLVAVAAAAACDLPPGFNEVEPGEGDRREVGTADVSPVPAGQELWETSFVGWQFGGALSCVGAALPGGAPIQNPTPTVVQVWDGVEDPCGETPDEGDRVVQIELSDISAGTYAVAQQCVEARTASVILGEVVGGRLFTRVAVQGTVTILGLENQNEPGEPEVLEGAFTVGFSDPLSDPTLGPVADGLPVGGIPVPQAQLPSTVTGGFTSGGFRGRALCF